MYERGLSAAQAVEWYRRPADQGYKIAQHALGTMYQTGYGVQQDYVQAHMWYNLSATQGWGAAAIGRTTMTRHR
jgi:TPR repeat protein